MGRLNKNLIIVRVFGGLGNQLFQYSFGLYMSKKLNRKVLYDFSYFETNNFREPSILEFNFKIEKAPYTLVKKYLPFKSFKLNNIYNRIFNSKSYYDREIQLNLTQPILFFHGYWQKKIFIVSQIEILRNSLKINNTSVRIKSLAQKILKSTSVSIHIRRGDYLLKKNQKIYKKLSPSFFFEAISFLEKNKSLNFTYFIFSDDISWAKKNFSSIKNIVFVDGNSDYEDLYLMSLCDHNIISNSTFSWWAATLNKNQNKLIISPKNWFNDRFKSTDELIDNKWITI